MIYVIYSIGILLWMLWCDHNSEKNAIVYMLGILWPIILVGSLIVYIVAWLLITPSKIINRIQKRKARII